MILNLCPFCQTKGLLRLDVADGKTGPVEYWVECPNHDCPVHPATAHYTTEDAASQAWNHRRNPPKHVGKFYITDEMLQQMAHMPAEFDGFFSHFIIIGVRKRDRYDMWEYTAASHLFWMDVPEGGTIPEYDLDIIWDHTTGDLHVGVRRR